MNNKLSGFNRDFYSQFDLFCELISKNKFIYEICDRIRDLDLTDYRF